MFEGRLKFTPNVVRTAVYNVGGEIEAVLQGTMDQRTAEEQIRPEGFVLFSVKHPTLIHVLQSAWFTFREWGARHDRVNENLQTLAEN